MNSTTYNGLTSIYGAEIKSIAPTSFFAPNMYGIGQDDEYVYIGGVNSYLRKFSKKTLQEVAQSPAVIMDILSGEFVTYNGYLYVGSSYEWGTGRIRKFDTTTMTEVAFADTYFLMGPGNGGVGQMHFYDGHMYVTHTNGTIKIYNADTLAYEDSFAVPYISSHPSIALSIIGHSGFLYVSVRSAWNGQSSIAKFNSSTFALVDEAFISLAGSQGRAMLLVGDHIYMSGDPTAVNYTPIYKYDLNLNQISSVGVTGNVFMYYLKYDGEFIYASAGGAYKYTTDLSLVAQNTNSDFAHGSLDSWVLDDKFIYTSGGNGHKKISKITLAPVSTTPRFNVINTTPFNIVSGGSIPLSGASLEMDYYRITSPSALITLNHPNSGTFAYDYGYLLEADYDCIEIWNAYSGLSAEAEWDYVLNNKSDIVYGIVSDGGYNVNDTATFNKGYIEIEDAITNEALLTNIKTGKFYAVKNGHYLRVNQTGNVLTAISNTDSTFEFISDTSTTILGNTQRARYNILGTERYIRVRCTDVDDNTKIAWSQPIPINWV